MTSRPSGAPALQGLGAAGLLALACGLLHGSALGNGWHFDDPAILNFATQYAPWQYFLQREAMLQQSYSSLTPWNALFYDLGLPWFGLAPRGHYGHMLTLLWATALATWGLLRRPLGAGPALLAGLLYLAAPPTAAIAQSLMTGHYAYGLLFSLASIAAFQRAVRPPAPMDAGLPPAAWALLAALAYGMACLCKELYVPLPALLLVLPLGPWRPRWRALLPVLVVAAGYLVLRGWVLGGVGGYAALAAEGGSGLQHDAAALARAAAKLRRLLMGEGPAGLLALALGGALLLVAAWRGRRPPLLLVAAATVLLLLPVAPMLLLAAFPDDGDRLGYAMGWALAVLAAWAGRSAAARRMAESPQAAGLTWPVGRLAFALPSLALLALAAALAFSQQAVIARTSGRGQAGPAEYAFLTQGSAGQVLVPEGFRLTGYLGLMAQAVARWQGQPAPRVLQDEDELLALGPVQGPLAMAWSADCGCVRPLGPEYAQRVQRFQQQLAAAATLPLQAELRLDSTHPRYKIFRWAVSGSPGTLHIDVRRVGRLTLPLAGQLAFGIDSLVPLTDPVQLRLTLQTPEGALIRSPLLGLPLQGLQRLPWQALAAAP